MEAAENFIPGATWAKQFLPKSNRVPLDRDLSWVPKGLGEYDELPMMEFEDELDIEDLSYEPETVWGPEGDPSIGMAGMEEYIPEWTGWNEEWGTDDLTMLDRDNQTTHQEDITETITEDDGEKFVLKEAKFSQGNLGTEGKYDYSPNLDLNIMNIQDAELRQKATEAAIRFNNVWLEGEDGEYYGQLEDLYQEYLDAVEAGAQPEDYLIEDINLTEEDFKGYPSGYDLFGHVLDMDVDDLVGEKGGLSEKGKKAAEDKIEQMEKEIEDLELDAGLRYSI